MNKKSSKTTGVETRYYFVDEAVALEWRK